MTILNQVWSVAFQKFYDFHQNENIIENIYCIFIRIKPNKNYKNPNAFK